MSSKFAPVDVPEDLPTTHGRAMTWIGQRVAMAHPSNPAQLANLAVQHEGVTRPYQAEGS